ncbi:MAG: FHA domain-containing protein [Myxococcota bacterium]|nr:FHA domain-containing protein [Myxococcota bacterium]
MTPLLLLSLTAGAEGLNATLTFASPAESGHGRVQVEITSPEIAADLGSAPGPDRFRAVVGRGDARVDRVQHVGSSGETVHTVLAFDRSGSFSAYWDDAFELAGAMADALPADGSHTVEVMSFHGNQTFHGAAATAADLRTLLAAVEAMGTLGRASETSLMSAVKDGARRAAEQQPTTGGRQVILFSDAGEEGAIFTLDETIAAVRAQGTVIHPVVLKQVAAPGSNKAEAFSRANDRMKKLAEASGGQHIHAQELASAKRLMVQHATVSERLYWLEVRYCAVPQGEIRFKDTVQIEVLQGSTIPAKTAATGFRQHAAGSALLACADLPPAASSAAAADLGAGQGTAGTTAEPGSASSRGWLWPTLIGALLLMLMLGGLIMLVLLASRKKKPEEQSPEPPPPPTPEPGAGAGPVITPRLESPIAQGSGAAALHNSTAELSDDPLALPAPDRNPLEKPPVETRLRIVSGPSGLEPYYRVSGSTFTIGGAPTADLCIDIPQISSHHATIKLFKLGTVYITDHSLNGTYLDGRRLKKGERTQVSPGQRIGLSQQLIVELWQPDTDPAPPPTTPAVPPPPPRKSRQKTVYGPLASAPPPVSASPAPPKRSKSKTIIQPLRKDDES